MENVSISAQMKSGCLFNIIKIPNLQSFLGNFA